MLDWWETQSVTRESLGSGADLHANKSIAIHYGTFRLANEGVDHPKEELYKALKKFKLTEHDFLILPEGKSETFSF